MSDELKEFHPIAESFGPVDGGVVELIAADMSVSGFDPRHPIILFEKKILAGRHRELGARKAKVDPVYKNFAGTIDEAKVYADRENLLRWHQSPEYLRAKRLQRCCEIAALRVEGLSLRSIAEKVGKSTTQIRKDLEWWDANGPKEESPPPEQVYTGGTPGGAAGTGNGEATVTQPFDTGASGGVAPPLVKKKKVKGRDGRSYDATRPKATVAAASDTEVATAEAPAIVKSPAAKATEHLKGLVKAMQDLAIYEMHKTNLQQIKDDIKDAAKATK